jgi:hypothetical protein
MSVARVPLAPVGETMFPPRSPFFESGGTSRFPLGPLPAHELKVSP